MTQRLKDGTIIPSIFNVGGGTNANDAFNNMMSLKDGIVTAIIYPDDPNTLSGKEIEYNVCVADYDHEKNINLNIYRNCRLVNIFGTTNDFVTYTLQPSTQSPTNLTGDDNENVFPDGARVLVLCMGGQTRAGSAIIIGGEQHRDQTPPQRSDGQFYNFQFNGINQLINNDGELIITFNSATDQDGDQSNAAAAGTQIKIDKNGVVTISDNENQVISVDRVAKQISIGNGSESIVVDKDESSITATSGKDENFNAGGKLSATSGDDMTISSGAALDISSEGQTSIKANGPLNMQTAGAWKVMASGDIDIQSSGDVTIESGQGPVIESAGPLVLIGQGSVPAAGVGISQCLGVGNLGAPVISNIITGSTTVFIGT